MASTLTLEEFIDRLHSEVNRFKKEYEESNKEEGDSQYPMHFSSEDWFDQWMSWNGMQDDVI